MERKLIGEIWGRPSLGGERSVANNDEDSITMAVEAARNCLQDHPRGSVDGLFFSTTTPPYVEKMSAVLAAAAVDLGREITTADFSNSLRAGTGALKAAMDAVNSGSMENVLVAAADCRNGYPRSDEEQNFGDGSAALLIGNEDVIASLEGHYAVCNEMMDVWRNPAETFVRAAEGRFIMGEGYTRHMKEVVAGILNKYGLKMSDIAKAVLPAPSIRVHRGLCRQLELDPDRQAQDPLLNHVGHCGTAQPILMLVGALESARPGDLLLLAAYAEGADALLFRVTENIHKAMHQRTIQDYLADKIMLNSYARFLSYRGVIEPAPGEPFRLLPSATATWRDRNSIIRCHGSRCRKCGVLAFPIQRVCYTCNARDDYDEEPISDLHGEVFTFTLDNLAGRSDDPVVVQTVAELGKDNVRFYGMMTDCEPSEVHVGMSVRLTFRRIYEGAGMHNYFWKCAPVREGRGA
jgi:3-hydroxy-3-methylglutaryl CoA synthase